ncbi:MAG: hypothetical protein M1371_01090 [Actinobacteria bacterium]|nr:hypothetical protein [Actinomycetota bacterium]
MIGFPDEVLKAVIEKALFRGNVLKTEIFFPSTNEIHLKRLILLNIDFNSSNIYFFLTTSNVKKFILGKYPDITGNFILIPKGQTLDNKNEDMVIDCRMVRFITKDKLFEKFKRKKLTSLKPLDNFIMKEVDRIIRESTLINDDLKKLILP